MFRKSLLLLTLCLGLAACEDPAERAEGYYQSALALVEEGDTERALLELRNVFDYDGNHTEARRLYADLLLEVGDVRQAYSQYLRLVEQSPNDYDLRVEMATLALNFGDWQEVERHASAAQELDPENITSLAFAEMFKYRDAREARDDVTAGQHVAALLEILETNPDLEVAQRVMIDWLGTGPDPARALPYIAQVLERRPTAFNLYMERLQILNVVATEEEIEAELLDMYERFPDNEDLVAMVVRWYVAQGNFEAIETFLRERAGADDENVEGHLAVVQLLDQVAGREQALAELDRLALANDGTELGRRYRVLKIALKFDPLADDEVKLADAAALQQLIEELETTDLRNEARIELVKIHGSMGNIESARSLIEEVLESDSSNVGALLLRGAWLIQDQSYGAAISDLRVALDQAPSNSDVLLLLAEAHQKLGNIALAEQRLARAVNVSGLAARETLIFAQFQIALGNLTAANQALSESLRVQADLEVARLLGQVMLSQGEFDDLNRLIFQLRNNDLGQDADVLANSLQAAMLFNQNRIEESIAFLRASRDVSEDEAGRFEADVQILRVQMMSGRLDDARVQLQKLRAQYPDSLALQLLQGNILSLEGNDDAAIAVYRRILEDNPNELIVIQRLYTALREVGQQDAASELLVRALDDQPEARALQSLRALEHERNGEFEEAIFIYEELYARNPNDVGVANNLASVLAYYRSGEEDLDRAYEISLRLVGSNLPEFQDTLGFIQMRRGDVNDAILNLQAATRGLPSNATIAFNLALAYAEAERYDEAQAELERGFQLAGRRTDVPQLGRARILERDLAALAAEGAEDSEEGN